MSSSQGTKVTNDPEALNNPKNENPGIVPKDSLAGESIKEGGSFGANSNARGPMDQKAAGLTANTTDTSGATRLDPAPDAEARQAGEAWTESAAMNAGQNLGSSSSSSSGGASGQTTTGTSSTGDVVKGDQIADTTNQSATGAAIPAQVAGGPKGANIQEGGFDGNERQAKFNVEPGSKDDPGRQALLDTDVPVSGGAGPRHQNISGDGQFDNLKDASA